MPAVRQARTVCTRTYVYVLHARINQLVAFKINYEDAILIFRETCVAAAKIKHERSVQWIWLEWGFISPRGRKIIKNKHSTRPDQDLPDPDERYNCPPQDRDPGEGRELTITKSSAEKNKNILKECKYKYCTAGNIGSISAQQPRLNLSHISG